MTRRWMLAAAVAVACGGWLAAVAQEPPPAAPGAAVQVATGAAAAAEPEHRMTLWQLWLVGGWAMYPLGLVNIAVLGFTIYGYLVVRENKMLATPVIPSLQEQIGKMHLSEAVRICAATPSMLTNVLHAGLQRLSDGYLDVPSLEKAMEEASVEETQAGLKTLNYISVSAQIAPMLGLLGTVSGMIKAFEKIGRGAMGKPELLANDIGEALITTAYGLIIGIPAMCFYFYLKGQYTANITKMGRVLGNLTHTLVAAQRRLEAQPGAEQA